VPGKLERVTAEFVDHEVFVMIACVVLTQTDDQTDRHVSDGYYSAIA